MIAPVRPLPPPDLFARQVSIWRIPKGAVLHRFHGRGFEAAHYDTGPDGRLNAPDGSYGVLYAAWTERGAFAETFLREAGRSLLPSDLVAAKAYVKFSVVRPLRIIRLYGRWLAPLGATAEVTSAGMPYRLPQAWSEALHAHSAMADGVAYYARHDNSETCIALFDRARDAIAAFERHSALDQEWFWALAERYGVLGAPTGSI